MTYGMREGPGYMAGVEESKKTNVLHSTRIFVEVRTK